MNSENGNGRIQGFQRFELNGGQSAFDVTESFPVSEGHTVLFQSGSDHDGGIEASKGDVLRGVIVAFAGVAIATKVPELGISIEAMGAAYAYVAKLRLRENAA